MTYTTKGRASEDPATWRGKITLRRVRLNAGGYDSGGAYWGGGKPLYWATDESSSTGCYFRAADREAAKAHIRARLPNAEFHR